MTYLVSTISCEYVLLVAAHLMYQISRAAAINVLPAVVPFLMQIYLGSIFDLPNSKYWIRILLITIKYASPRSISEP